MLPRSPFDIAMCDGKVRFETWLAAQCIAGKRAKRRAHKRRFSQRIYSCRVCHGFHIGTRSGKPVN